MSPQIKQKPISKLMSLVIPARGSSQNLSRLLESIGSQTLLAETIVIYNPKPKFQTLDDGPLALNGLLRFGFSEAGVGKARNAGARLARGPWLFYLDDDCLLDDPTHIERLEQKLAQTSDDVIIGGPYKQWINPSMPAEDLRLSKEYAKSQLSWLATGRHKKFGWIHFLGGNLVVAKSTVLNRPFCEKIQIGGSETEATMRWLRAGAQGEFLDSFPVQHLLHTTNVSFFSKAFFQGCTDQRTRREGIFIPSEWCEPAYKINEYREVFQMGQIWQRTFGVYPSPKGIRLLYRAYPLLRWALRWSEHRKQLKRLHIWLGRARTDS